MPTYMEPVRVRPKNESEAIKDFTPPYIEAGWFIRFFIDADRGTSPHNGICKAVSGSCITADVYEQGRVVNRINLRHIDDPRAQSTNMKKWGAWDLVDTREMRAVRELEAKVTDLSGRLAILELREGSPKVRPGQLRKQRRSANEPVE